MEQESVQSGNRKEKYGDSCENQRNNTEYSYNKDSQSLITCQSMFCHQEVLAQTYFFCYLITAWDTVLSPGMHWIHFGQRLGGQQPCRDSDHKAMMTGLMYGQKIRQKRKLEKGEESGKCLWSQRNQ